jgi:hypothetical protein
LDAISCDRVSLLITVTVCPTATVTDAGETPAAVIVMVAPLVPPVPPSFTTAVTLLGELGELPPHAATRLRERTEQARRARMRTTFRRICVRC